MMRECGKGKEMKLINIIDEDFTNYKKPAMFIITPYCSLKCDMECGREVCQNSSLLKEPTLDIDKEIICERYLSNPITSAIVIGGMEPFDSKTDLLTFVNTLRNKYQCKDDIVIYTGYTEEELRIGARAPKWTPNQILADEWKVLLTYPNIIVKFGRFIPDQDSHFDQVLGVNLASSNQYGRKVS